MRFKLCKRSRSNLPDYDTERPNSTRWHVQRRLKFTRLPTSHPLGPRPAMTHIINASIAFGTLFIPTFIGHRAQRRRPRYLHGYLVASQATKYLTSSADRTFKRLPFEQPPRLPKVDFSVDRDRLLHQKDSVLEVPLNGTVRIHVEGIGHCNRHGVTVTQHLLPCWSGTRALCRIPDSVQTPSWSHLKAVPQWTR